MWAHRHVCIKRLPLPDDCIHEVNSYLHTSKKQCYSLKNEIFLELIRLYTYSNPLNEYDFFVFGDADPFLLQSEFCVRCGNFLRFNQGVMEGKMMCNC